jgi:hypothetical protein
LGKITTVQPNVTLNLGRSLTLSVNHYYERLTHDGDEIYLANLTDFRLSWQFNLRQRLRLALVRGDFQFDNGSGRVRDLSSQLIYSYKINPRTAMYVGYADNYFGDQDQTLFQTGRALFVKLGYAWER